MNKWKEITSPHPFSKYPFHFLFSFLCLLYPHLFFLWSTMASSATHYIDHLWIRKVILSLHLEQNTHGKFNWDGITYHVVQVLGTNYLLTSVLDQHLFYADPDPGKILMRIRIHALSKPMRKAHSISPFVLIVHKLGWSRNPSKNFAKHYIFNGNYSEFREISHIIKITYCRWGHEIFS